MIMTLHKRVSAFAMMLVIALALSVCSAMLAKNKRPYDPTVLPPAQRLRRNIQDIVADNLLSNARSNELLRDVARCRISGFRGFRPTRSNKTQGDRLRRNLTKHSK